MGWSSDIERSRSVLQRWNWFAVAATRDPRIIKSSLPAQRASRPVFWYPWSCNLESHWTTLKTIIENPWVKHLKHLGFGGCSLCFDPPVGSPRSHRASGGLATTATEFAFTGKNSLAKTPGATGLPGGGHVMSQVTNWWSEIHRTTGFGAQGVPCKHQIRRHYLSVPAKIITWQKWTAMSKTLASKLITHVC